MGKSSGVLISNALNNCKNVTRDWNRNDVCVSAWCALSFIGLGTGLVIISPTILDLASYISVSLSDIAAMLLVRSVGSVIGSVLAGILFDRLIRYSLWFIVIYISLASIVTCVIPFSTHLAILGTIFFFHGLLLGGLDTGVHAFLMDVWKNKESGPVFQLIHFAYAIGAFLSPLIARPFIGNNEQVESLANSTTTDLTCTDLLNHTTTDNSTNECWRLLLLVANNCTTTALTEGSGSMTNDDCISSSNNDNSTFRYAYWVSVIPMILSLPGLIVYAIKGHCTPIVTCRGVKNAEHKEVQEEKEEKKDSKPLSYPDTMIYKAVLLTLLFLMMLLYVGGEVNYGTYIFAYSVKSQLQFSKEKATVISSLFWGTFAFFRFFSITLSLCNVSPSVMLSGNLIGSFIASLIVAIGSNNELAMWIGSALMGISFASTYPNIVNWLIQHGPATGKATSILSAGATIGDMTLPVLVGVLIDKVGPVSLCYFTLVDISLCCLLFTALFVIAHKCKVKKSGRQYLHLQQDEAEGNGLEEITQNNTPTVQLVNIITNNAIVEDEYDEEIQTISDQDKLINEETL